MIETCRPATVYDVLQTVTAARGALNRLLADMVADWLVAAAATPW